MELNLIKNSFKESWVFLKKNFKWIAIEILKIEILSLVSMFVGLLAFGIVIYAIFTIFSDSLIELTSNNIYILLLIIPLILFGIVLSLFPRYVLILMSYNIVDAALDGKKIVVSKTFWKNFFPVLKYGLLYLGITLLALIPMFIILVVVGIGSLQDPDSFNLIIMRSLVELSVRSYNLIVGGIIYLFTQFAIFELLVKRLSAFKSFRNSYSLVRSNLYETAGFSLALWIIELGLYVVFLLPLLVIIGIGILVSLSLISNVWLMALPLSIMFLLILILFILIQSVVKTILFTTRCIYWKKVSKDKAFN